MRLLLDSNIVVPLMQREIRDLGARIRLLLGASSNDAFVSAASLWEIAIKTRIGKLDPGVPLEEMPVHLAALNILILAVDERHALEELATAPDTKDPFDRLLLAQCQVERLRLVTTDRILSKHPLAWRPE